MRTRQCDKETLYQLYYVQGKTLADIGEIWGVTRERVRQIFEQAGLPRTKNRSRRHPNTSNKYPDLDTYLSDYKGTSNGNHIIRRFLLLDKCQECGCSRNLHLHHKTYPARSKDDIEILCASCHHIKHKKGITHKKRIEICSKYFQGTGTKDLAKEYVVSRVAIYKIIRLVRQGAHSFLDIKPLKNKQDLTNLARSATL